MYLLNIFILLSKCFILATIIGNTYANLFNYKSPFLPTTNNILFCLITVSDALSSFRITLGTESNTVFFSYNPYLVYYHPYPDIFISLFLSKSSLK